MRKLIVGFLLFAAGWGLAWYMFHYREADQPPSARTAIPVPAPAMDPAAAEAPASFPGHQLRELLADNDFDPAVEFYESLQGGTDEAAAADARTRILVYARELIATRRFSQAERLLLRFLIAAHRDVEARILLAEAYYGQDDYRTAIDQLYEAGGYAYRPAMLERISARIRTMVAERAQALKGDDDRNALLALYEHLTRLEPDHAPWFLQLAAAQLALDDLQGARHSLLLITQDPAAGAQAQAMLADLELALADTAPEDAAAASAGIPLYRRGEHYIVEAQPAHGRSLRLLIDTGASLTILTPAVLEQPGIRYVDTGRTGVFKTANGPVQAPIYRLAALAVGDWQVTRLEVGVLDLGSGADIDGLLGMNFLRHFRFFIDQNEALLRLSGN
jgi:clan AA aspartic protease (TIGR02281 family)